MACGDLAFYYDGTSVFDWAIRKRTGSRISHVEVEVENGLWIGALTRGVDIHPTPAASNVKIWHSDAVSTSPKLSDGLKFLHTAVDNKYKYGAIDIFNQLLSLVKPDGIFLDSPTLFDCSHLAADFLITVDYPLPAELKLNPELVTPGSLARALGIDL